MRSLLQVLALLLACTSQAVYSQDTSSTSSGYVSAAREAAGSDWADSVNGFCGLNPARQPKPSAARRIPWTPVEREDWKAQPAKLFDNLYFVGSKGVSAFAIVTGDGIIITDAMWDYDVKGSVVDGLTAMGLDPSQIKYVIIPHGHPDHFGGAQFLRDTFGAEIVVPRADIPLIQSYEGLFTTARPEGYDLFVDDGNTLTLGDTTVTFHAVAGHSPGGVVLTFPVIDQGVSREMLIWASVGGAPSKLSDLQAQIPGLEKLVAYARANKVEVLAQNHGGHVGAQAYRHNPEEGNPFVVGNDSVVGYLDMRMYCDRARLVKANEALLGP